MGIEELLEQLRAAAAAPPQTNRQKRSTDKFARVKGDALLKVLNRVVRELQKLRQAVLSSRSARKGKKLSSKKKKNSKAKKGKNRKKNKGKSKRKGKKLNNKKGKKKPKNKNKKKKSKNRG